MAKQLVTKRPTKGAKEDVLIDVAEVTKETTSFFETYRKPLLYGAIALVAIIGATVAWKAYVASNQTKAVQAMWRAERLFEQDSFALALNNVGGGYEGLKEAPRAARDQAEKGPVRGIKARSQWLVRPAQPKSQRRP